MKKINSLLIYLKNNNFSKQYNFLKKIAGLDGLLTYEIVKIKSGQTLGNIADLYEDNYRELDEYKDMQITSEIVKEYHNNNIGKINIGENDLEEILNVNKIKVGQEILIPVTWYYVDEESSSKKNADKPNAKQKKEDKDVISVGGKKYQKYIISSGDSLSGLAGFFRCKITDLLDGISQEKMVSESKIPNPGEHIWVPLRDSEEVTIPIPYKERGSDGKTKQNISVTRGTFGEEVVAVTLIGEGGSIAKNYETVMKNVFSVIQNRANNCGVPLEKICLYRKKRAKRYQFSHWNENPYKMNSINDFVESPDKRVLDRWNAAMKIVKNKEVSTEVGDSTHYVVAGTLSKILSGEIGQKTLKEWKDCFKEIYRDSHHVFGKMNKTKSCINEWDSNCSELK